MRLVVRDGEDERLFLVPKPVEQFEGRGDAVAYDEDQLADLEPRCRFGAIANEDEIEAFVPKPLKRLVQRRRDALDEDNDRGSPRRSRATHLIFDERPAGERDQRRKLAGIILLIGSDQSAERQNDPSTFVPSPVPSKRAPNRFCNGFHAGTKMISCPT